MFNVYDDCHGLHSRELRFNEHRGVVPDMSIWLKNNIFVGWLVSRPLVRSVNAHICQRTGKFIDSGDDVLPVWHQSITLSDAELLSTYWNFTEIWIKIYFFLSRKCIQNGVYDVSAMLFDLGMLNPWSRLKQGAVTDQRFHCEIEWLRPFWSHN